MEQYVDLFTRMCANQGITGEGSRLGVHLTLFPTFWATEKQARFGASLIELTVAGCWHENLGGGGSPQVKLEGIGFFKAPPGSTKEALHLRVGLSSEYLNLISRLKASDIFEWVTPPTRTQPVDPIFIPHVHIIEGEDMIRRVAPIKDDLSRIVGNDMSASLGQIHLFKKIEVRGKPSTWEMVII